MSALLVKVLKSAMYVRCSYLPPTKEVVYVFPRMCELVCVCLSVCVQDYSKTHAWIWMKCCMSTDVGTWTN